MSVKKKSRFQCRQEIDGEICRLQGKRRLMQRAEGRHFAVRQLAPLKDTIRDHDYVCFRAEYRGGRGTNELIQHNGNFKKLAHAVSRIYTEDGGQVTSFHFTDDPENTSCAYWARRARKGLRGGRRRRR